MANENESKQERQVHYTLEEVNDVLELNSVTDLVERFIQPEHGKSLKVIKVEKSTNNRLNEKFANRQGDMFGYSTDTTKLKFHGTPSKSLKKILNHGFKIPENPGMYGRGIYFATDSSKSAQYTHGENQLLLCEVALGKPMVVSTADHDISFESVVEAGYDSVYAPRNTKSTHGVMFDEFVVYHRYQAIPKYVITYQENMLASAAGESSFQPYSDEVLRTDSVMEGPTRWKKSVTTTKWSERYLYVIESRYVTIFKSEKAARAAHKALYNEESKPKDIPECTIDIMEIDTLDVKEELNVLILMITCKDGTTQYFASEQAHSWMQNLLQLRVQIKRQFQQYATTEEKDSDDEEAPEEAASSSTTSSPALSEYEARKQARKAKLGQRVEVRQFVARAKKEKVAVYDETSGNYLGLLANPDAIKKLPSPLTKMALHSGILALKTESSWKILYCVLDAQFFTVYRPNPDDKKNPFKEFKKWELGTSQIRPSSYKFGQRLVPAFTIASVDQLSTFCGMNMTEWLDYFRKFAVQKPTSLLTQKEVDRWNRV